MTAGARLALLRVVEVLLAASNQIGDSDVDLRRLLRDDAAEYAGLLDPVE